MNQAAKRISPHTSAPIERPLLAMALTEVPRAMTEMAMLPMCLPRLYNAPRGDGHPVLILPGFLTSDVSTYPLRNFLMALGYEAYPWELGRNFGIKSVGEFGEIIRARIEALADEAGEKVSLVGWSLGGIISRQMARQIPDQIRQVISLGSPFTGDPAATNVTKIYEKLTGDVLDEAGIEARLAEESGPVPVPSTAIYSRLDGVTAWENCLDAEEQDETENIEVYGSHMGLTMNPAVWSVVADRLALPEGEWAPFDRGGLRKWVFPVRGSIKRSAWQITD